jgi:hypothetical protein
MTAGIGGLNRTFGRSLISQIHTSHLRVPIQWSSKRQTALRASRYNHFVAHIVTMVNIVLWLISSYFFTNSITLTKTRQISH